MTVYPRSARLPCRSELCKRLRENQGAEDKPPDDDQKGGGGAAALLSQLVAPPSQRSTATSARRADDVEDKGCKYLRESEKTKFPTGAELLPFLPGGRLETPDIEDLVRRGGGCHHTHVVPCMQFLDLPPPLSRSASGLCPALRLPQAKYGREKTVCPYFGTKDLLLEGAGLILVRTWMTGGAPSRCMCPCNRRIALMSGSSTSCIPAVLRISLARLAQTPPLRSAPTSTCCTRASAASAGCRTSWCVIAIIRPSRLAVVLLVNIARTCCRRADGARACAVFCVPRSKTRW